MYMYIYMYYPNYIIFNSFCICIYIYMVIVL